MRGRELLMRTYNKTGNLTSLNEILNMAETANFCGVYRIRTTIWYLFIDDIHKDPFFNAYYD